MRKKRKNLFQAKLKTVAWFLFRFNLLAIPLYLAIFTGFSFQPLQTFLAQITAAALQSQGHHADQNNQILVVAKGDNVYTIEISWDSTGWKSLYALFALVFAFPGSIIDRKLRFLAVGLPVIFILNLLRILTTIYVMLTFGFRYFDVVHTLLWREGLIIAVVLIWYVWLRKERIIKYYIR